MAKTIKIEPPNERQKLFLKAEKRFVAYGGARGGGKSWAVRTKSKLLGLNYAGIRQLIIRRTYAELEGNHIRPLQAELQGVATYNESKKLFTFSNGSIIKMGYSGGDADVSQYQGQEYDIIFIDEATQFTEYQYATICATLRGVNAFPKRVYLTCNPGGVGHTWVKRLFIDKQYNPGENPDDYMFIPAKVDDNTALMAADPEYKRNLENLPPDLREAWLNGNWDLFVGQYFTEFKRDIHVIEPFVIPAHWRRYFSMDYGLDMLAGYYYAVDEHGRAIAYKEIYKPSLIVSDAAALIKATTNEHIYAYYAPPDLWNRRQETGKSVADIFREHGINLQIANNNRVDGWLNVKEWLKPYTDEQGIATANIRITSNCTNLIRCLPLIQYDDKDPNDCATEPHEVTHAPDALRYFIAGRPRATHIEPPKPIYNFNSERPKPDALRGTRNVI